MYNRYIPQPDGSYCRNRCQEPTPKPKPQPAPPPDPPCPPPPPSCPPPEPAQRPCPRPQSRPCGGSSVTDFLKHLLPKDFDTADLLIVLLLLLMAGDCREDQNTALLTLVLYLFL